MPTKSQTAVRMKTLRNGAKEDLTREPPKKSKADSLRKSIATLNKQIAEYQAAGELIKVNKCRESIANLERTLQRM